MPDYSTLSRRQKTLHVQLPYRPSATALDLLVNSTGIKFLGEGEWKRGTHYGRRLARFWHWSTLSNAPGFLGSGFGVGHPCAPKKKAEHSSAQPVVPFP